MLEINSIDTTTEEGRLLMAALAKITTESQTDKTPYEVLAQLQELEKKMVFDSKADKQYSFGIGFMHLGYKIGWIRIFGKGFHWKNTKYHRLYFSERNGRDKSITIGDWRIKWLRV